MQYPLPQPVSDIMAALGEAGFEAFAVGGSVRDLVLGRAPKDWDLATNARPEEVQKLFPDHVYENTFGTVGIKVPRFLSTTPERFEHDIIEVTTYRRESAYTDKRRPEQLDFVTTLEEDLSRRDFTINALAYGKRDGAFVLIDPYAGQTDLKEKVIRTVGDPHARFREDALRLMRAVRFAAELRDPKAKEPRQDWRIEDATFVALKEEAAGLQAISQERIRDEFSKIILSDSPAYGVELLEAAGLLQFIIPELREGIGVTQNLHHIYTVWEHNVRALATCPSRKLSVRLAALLHDVAKPRTKRGEGYRSTFYNHDHVGARMTRVILTRMRYPRAVVEKATLLVDNHLFYYNVDEVTEASVRRLVKRVGLQNMDDLMAVRIGDRLGSGVPKAKPYKLRHLEYMIEKVSQDPLSAKMLALKGTDLIETLAIPAGPKIGALLDILLAEVIEDPKRNTRETLLARARELASHDTEELRRLAKQAIEEEKTSQEKAIKKKHYVE